MEYGLVSNLPLSASVSLLVRDLASSPQVTLLLKEPYSNDGAFAGTWARGGLSIANLCGFAS